MHVSANLAPRAWKGRESSIESSKKAHLPAGLELPRLPKCLWVDRLFLLLGTKSLWPGEPESRSMIYFPLRPGPSSKALYDPADRRKT